MNAGDLVADLRATWQAQAATGFLLSDPEVPVEARFALDPATGVEFRFRWLPHRELRRDPAELARRGILDRGVDHSSLFADARDPEGRFCPLCPDNVRVAYPAEQLVPVAAGGRRWSAGANFAWLAADHFTVMADDHIDQTYGRNVLETMVDLHRQTDGRFRVVYNGHGAGATIPWHLHFHITTEPLPVESLIPGTEGTYPAPLDRFDLGSDGIGPADAMIRGWTALDPLHHRVNLLVAGDPSAPAAYVVRRDTRRADAAEKGLMGGFEAAGDFAYSEPRRRADFERADLDTARRILRAIRPPALD